MIDINNPQSWVAGRELDAEIARVMGYIDPEIDAVDHSVTAFNPDDMEMTDLTGLSTSWEGMGLMLEWIKSLKFSDRQKICKLIQKYLSLGRVEKGQWIAFPDAILWLKPVHVARAILAWHAAQQEGETG